MRDKVIIGMISLFIFCSCKKDNNSLPQIDLKKAILGKWEYHGKTVFKHNGEQVGEGVFFRYPIYNFLDSDSCISNRPDTARFKINYNTQINFTGTQLIDRGLYDVQIKDSNMLWHQVPPFYKNDIDSIIIYFKKH